MAPTESKRRIQIHLSTAVVLMVWAGVMLGMNLKAGGGSTTENRNEHRVEIREEYRLGWPDTVYYRNTTKVLDLQTGQTSSFARSSIVNFFAVIVDVMVLVLPAILLEKLVRYRAAKNSNPTNFL